MKFLIEAFRGKNDAKSSSTVPTKKKSSSKKPLKVEDEHENVRLGKAFFRTINKHETAKLRTMFLDDAKCEMTEGTIMEATMFLQVLDDLFKSFPDFHVSGARSPKLQPDGSIIFTGLEASGTHTGEPYGFGPYEKLPAEGKRFVNDKETVQVFFKDGKVARYVFLTHGRLSGPPGVYTQLGGFPLM